MRRSAAVNVEECDDDSEVASFVAYVTKATIDPSSGQLKVELTLASDDDEFVAWPLKKNLGFRYAVRMFSASEKVRADADGMRSKSRVEAAKARRLANEAARAGQ